MAKSVFESLDYAELIETDYVRKSYEEDTNLHKVNLSVEAFRTDEGKPFVLPIVRATEVQIAYDKRTNHEYLPVAGNPHFRDAAIKLILGEDSRALLEEAVLGIQCPGGTGCLRLAAEFLKRQLGYNTVYVSKPTWDGHKDIFKQAFFSNIVEYRYWDQDTRGLDFSGMLEDLKNAPEKSVVILQAVAHNPTGVDPTKEQWQIIANVCQNNSSECFCNISCHRKQQVNEMADRIKQMRHLLVDKLKIKGTPGDWDHIISQKGMFCYTGLTPEQVKRMTKDHGIYLLSDGRINVSAVTDSNVDYVVNAIDDVVVNALGETK